MATRLDASTPVSEELASQINEVRESLDEFIEEYSENFGKRLRVEKIDRLTSLARGDVWLLIKVASVTRQRQIREFVATLMLTGDDVFDVKRNVAKFLRQATILTAIAGPPPHRAVPRWNATGK